LRAIIFANGELRFPGAARAAVRDDDLIIAADGGLHHCKALNLVPDILLGDFDSLDEKEVQTLEDAGVAVVRHPRRKDTTDLEIALDHALARGVSQIFVYGALGTRWDQSIANVLLGARADHASADIRLVDGPQEARLLRAGETMTLHGQPGDTVSLIPLDGDARGITTTGLEYPLDDGTLHFGSSRGVSNTLQRDRSTISLRAGLLLCVLIHGPIEQIEME
jgi:thiamine pyrophosphokinase